MHDEKLLGQAEPASLGACLVGVRPGQELPLDVVVEALVLQAPNVACQPGSDPFAGVPEVVSVVVVPELPGGGGHANVPLLGLASGEDVGLVDDMVVFTPGSIHWTLLSPPTTVAVGISWPLLREDVSYDLCIVATDDLGQAVYVYI